MGLETARIRASVDETADGSSTGNVKRGRNTTSSQLLVLVLFTPTTQNENERLLATPLRIVIRTGSSCSFMAAEAVYRMLQRVNQAI